MLTCKCVYLPPKSAENLNYSFLSVPSNSVDVEFVHTFVVARVNLLSDQKLVFTANANFVS